MGRPIERPRAVEDQAGLWLGACAAAGEGVKDGLSPRPGPAAWRAQLEDVAVIIRTVAGGRAIECAFGVEDQASGRSGAIAGARETVKHIFGPRPIAAQWRLQLEYHATAVTAASLAASPGRAIQPAEIIEDQAGERKTALSTALAAMDNLFRPNSPAIWQ